MPNESQNEQPQNDTTPTMEEIIKDVAGKPKTVTVDGQTVQSQSISDLIKADEHLSKKKNAAKSPIQCLHFIKIPR